MYFIGTSIISGGGIAPLSDQVPTGADNEVYEMLRTQDGKALFLSDHMERFAQSIRKAGKQLPEYFGKVPSLIEWLMICNPQRNCDLKLCLSPNGLFQGGFVPSAYPTSGMYAEGVQCELLNAERANPNAKIFHADMRSAAAEQQSSKKVFESLLVNASGHITEGSRSNVFFVKDGALFTAPDNAVLIGIMRKKIVEMCPQLGIAVNYADISEKNLPEYDAAFISSTPARILPIRQIGAYTFDVNNHTVRQLMQSMDNEIKKQISGK